jgi:transcriptional regulator with XRE-family HTH domain
MRAVSQKEIARNCGISAAQVSQIETGKYAPSLDVLVRLLDVLGASLEIRLVESQADAVR